MKLLIVVEMEERITLDKNAFKALASETRVEVLKRLDYRRMTQSELAHLMGLSVQAISEHLEKLEDAGLVVRKDEGRKWVYYELTDKGYALLHPERKNFWVLLGISLLMITFGAWRIAMTAVSPPVYATADQSPPVLAAAGFEKGLAAGENGNETLKAMGAGAPAPNQTTTTAGNQSNETTIPMASGAASQAINQSNETNKTTTTVGVTSTTAETSAAIETAKDQQYCLPVAKETVQLKAAGMNTVEALSLTFGAMLFGASLILLFNRNRKIGIGVALIVCLILLGAFATAH
ncbi:winged helix-turn-helix transcriptional regulator [Candidatus Micrarchaeota archaeon]|nr:winged helix-turn-helix transcriptional regulator [Candidatus Micrarchaeota archaeon]